MGSIIRRFPIPRGGGSKIQAAEGYALKRVNEALGDVASFNSMLAEYKKAPISPGPGYIWSR